MVTDGREADPHVSSACERMLLLETLVTEESADLDSIRPPAVADVGASRDYCIRIPAVVDHNALFRIIGGSDLARACHALCTCRLHHRTLSAVGTDGVHWRSQLGRWEHDTVLPMSLYPLLQRCLHVVSPKKTVLMHEPFAAVMFDGQG